MPPIGATNQLKALYGGLAQPGQTISSDPYGLNVKSAATPTTSTSQLSNYTPYMPDFSKLYPQTPIGHAANFDTGAAYSQAMQQAHAQTDPYYNLKINQFNAYMAQQQQQAQGGLDLQKANIQNSLENVLQQNEISGQRVGEDTSNALSNLANYQQNYKETEGLNFDQAQRALQGNLGAAGTSTSGLGQQQVQTSQRQEALGQQAQGQQYQTQRQAEQLFNNRSLEDLSRGSAQAGTSAGLQTQGAQFDFDKQMAALNYQQTSTNQDLEKQRQQELLANRSIDATNIYNQFIQGLGGNALDIAATRQKYGYQL